MIAPPKTPSHDELELLIKEARARQLRRRLFSAASVAIAAVVALATYALLSDSGQTGSSTGSARKSPPVCRSSQLSTSFSVGGAAGTALGPMSLANTSSRACAIPDLKPVVRVSFRGKLVPIVEKSWSPADQLGKPAARVLAPGTKVYIELGWRGWCPRPAAAPTHGAVTVTLRLGGLRISAPESTPEGIPSIPGCSEVARPAVAVSRPLTPS